MKNHCEVCKLATWDGGFIKRLAGITAASFTVDELKVAYEETRALLPGGGTELLERQLRFPKKA